MRPAIVIPALAFLLVLAEPQGEASAPKKVRTVSVEAPAKTVLVGERLLFDVFWMGVPVGTGELDVKEKIVRGGRHAIRVTATARTNDFLSKLYPVHDEVESVMDAEDFHSFEFKKILREGRYRADERTVFDPENKKGFYESFLNGSKKEFPIGGKVHDILSAFFWFRTQPAVPGSVLTMQVNSEEKDWTVEAHVLRIEQKELRGKRIVDTILVEPRTRLKEVFYSRGKALVYFSTDSRRAPVWVTFKTPFGPICGVLRQPDQS